MRRRIFLGTGALCAALCAIASAPRNASGASKAKRHVAAPRKPPQKNLKKPAAAARASGSDTKTSGDADGAVEKSNVANERDADRVQSAPNSATKIPAPAASATVQEDKAGVKTYKFGTVEVESRAKSPQIIYFMRRVRAEFDAGALGHRSFMRELSDTRNNSALR